MRAWEDGSKFLSGFLPQKSFSRELREFVAPQTAGAFAEF
jgi:hypothetical protein